MLPRILITIAALTFGLAVPMLEINDTHVFNPDWTPHVRIHEVWQLITNSSIAVFCLWLVWIKREVFLPALLGLFITGGFLAAFFIRDLYGGSMKYLDGSEKTVVGINIGLLGFGVVVVLLLSAMALDRRPFRAAGS